MSAEKIDDIIAGAFNADASSIHIEPDASGATVRYRTDGVLKVIEHLDRNTALNVTRKTKLMGGLDPVAQAPQDGRIQLSMFGKELDVRVSIIPSIEGDSVCLYLLRKEIRIPGFDEIPIREEDLTRLRSWYQSPCGRMIITCGPSGSGKTTLLYMIVNELNRDTAKICTIEDPVEYRLEGITQIRVNPREGMTFASVSRTLLRHDPDVMVVGEVRDSKTVFYGADFVLTGHLWLSSLHTENSIAAVFRLKDLELSPFVITDCRPGIISQRLLRRLCPDCREQYVPDADEVKELNLSDGVYYRSKGCEKCHNTGYRGRIPIFELFEFSSETAKLFINGCEKEELMKQAVGEGMKTLMDDAVDKAAQGLTCPEEIVRVLCSRYPEKKK